MDPRPYPKKVSVVVEYHGGGVIEIEATSEYPGDIEDVTIDPAWEEPTSLMQRPPLRARFKLGLVSREWNIKKVEPRDCRTQ